MSGAQRQRRPAADDDQLPAPGSVYLLYWSPELTRKMYVGKDEKCLNGSKRYKDHLRDACNGSKLAIHNAIAKHGPPHKLILFRSTSTSLLKFMEDEFILEFDTLSPKGYNLRRGGDDSPMKNPEVAARQGVKMRGDRNPMKRPDVFARAAESRNAFWRNNPEARAKMSALKRDDPEVAAQLAALHTDPEVQAKLSVSLRTSSKAQAARARSLPLAIAARVYNQHARAAAALTIEVNALNERACREFVRAPSR
jgi:hypothetical protein